MHGGVRERKLDELERRVLAAALLQRAGGLALEVYDLEVVARDEHLPEDFTAFLARDWAHESNGRSITWPAAAMAWCDRHEKPLPGARDPNYLTPAEAHDNPWAVALRTPDKSPVSDAPPL